MVCILCAWRSVHCKELVQHWVVGRRNWKKTTLIGGWSSCSGWRKPRGSWIRWHKYILSMSCLSCQLLACEMNVPKSASLVISWLLRLNMSEKQTDQSWPCKVKGFIMEEAAVLLTVIKGPCLSRPINLPPWLCHFLIMNFSWSPNGCHSLSASFKEPVIRSYFCWGHGILSCVLPRCPFRSRWIDLSLATHPELPASLHRDPGCVSRDTLGTDCRVTSSGETVEGKRKTKDWCSLDRSFLRDSDVHVKGFRSYKSWIDYSIGFESRRDTGK